jgi:hypothetical protein
MTVRKMLVITAVLGTVFGLGYLLFPAAMLAAFGATTDAVGLMTARFFGGAVLGYGLVAWAHRGSSLAEACSKVVPAFALIFGLAFILSVTAQLMGLLNPVAWLSALTFLLLALGFGYLQFARNR